MPDINIVGLETSVNSTMPNQHPTRRNNQSLVSQFKAAWLTVIIGSVMFSGGMWLLFWNEGRAVITSKALEEAMNTVVPLQSPVAHEENSGYLVHLSGILEIGEPLTEPEYGVSLAAVKLKRRIQMYQWVEEEYRREARYDDLVQSEEVSYSYITEWRDKLVDSSKFYVRTGHENPIEFPMKTIIYVSELVTVGNFILGSNLKDMFTEFVIVTSDERPERRDIKLHSELYYHSQDVWSPEVGDIRVQFSYAGKSGTVVSIVAMQVGNKLEPFRTSTGRQILLLRSGYLSVEDMFHYEHGQNWSLTWILRVVGWLILFLGANCSTNIFRILVSRYSILYDIFVLGIGSINMAVSMSTSLLVISFAWIWYRPLLGLSILFTAILPFLLSAFRIYRADAAETRSYRRL